MGGTKCTKLIALVFLFMSFNTSAQDKWEQARIVYSNGDISNVLICLDCSSLSKIKVVLNNSKKARIRAKDLKSFTVRGKTFESLSKSSGYYFYQRITCGEIAIYIQSGRYYISNKNLAIPLTKSNYKKQILKRLNKESKLFNEIEDISTNYENFVDIIKKHNEQYIQISPEKTNVNELDVISNEEEKKLFENEDSLLLWNNSAVFKIGFDGISVEPKIGKQTTVYTGLGANVQLYGNKEYTEVSVTPVGIWQVRFYTNLRERLRRGKSIEGFSGNYFSPSFIYFGEPFNFYGGGLVMGNQRVRPKGVYTGYHFGLTTGYSDLGEGITAMFIYGFKFGFAPWVRRSHNKARF